MSTSAAPIRMKRILCATDFSPRSELALDRAIALSRQLGAALTLLHVVDHDQPLPAIDNRVAEAEVALLARARTIQEQAGITATVEVRSGTIFESINEAAQSSKPDLLVMGAHRRRLLSDVFTGTTLERVLRTGETPVLMVNAATFVPYESVLLALDTSEASARAARSACGLGLLSGTDIVVVHAFEPMYKGMMGWAGVQEVAVDEYSASWAREAREGLQRFLQSIGVGGAEQNLLLEEGPPFLAIKRVVERLRPHLLVIGTRGHTGFKRLLLGSVAERVTGAKKVGANCVAGARAIE
jgi:universal stress protein E